MNISRFFGSTNREALRQVRLALGDEALIVSNRRVNGGVEILATDPTSASNAAARATTPPSQAAATGTSSTPQRSQPPVSQPPAPESEEDVMGAIGEMRGALENRIDELLWGNQLKGAPQAAVLFQTLLGYGFSTALLRALLKRLPAQLNAKAGFQWARNELVTHLPVLASEDDLWRPGLALALVGPTGVGKTTTIAKLAARCVKRYGPESLVLITTDTYRIGAHEQLKIYGQLLRVPVHVVQDVTELQRVVQSIRPEQNILIDNVGISQRDSYITEQAAMLAGSGRRINRLLVLNASSHGDTLDEVARTYANDGGVALQGCIITKIDEASRLGAALDTVIRYQLPIHYVSNGQKVPENLLWLSASDLVDQALVQNKKIRALYSPSEADFAALMSLTRVPENKSQTQAAENRRKRLLPGLLSMTADAEANLSMGDLEEACRYIDEAIAVSEAYDLWRGLSATPADTSPLSSYTDHMIRVAKNDFSANDSNKSLAIHDHLRVVSATGGRGALRVSLLLNDKGLALSSPMQQLGFADGWRSSCGLAASAAPTAAAALIGQVSHLHQYHQDLPLVHLVDGANQSVLRQMSDLGVSWLAHTSSVMKIQHQSCGTTVAAVAKILTHRPLSDPDTLPTLSELARLLAADTVLWVAHELVYLHARQHEPMPVQLLSVRLVNRHNGNTEKTLYGLSNLLSDQISPDVLGAWLMLRSEVKSGLRHMSKSWHYVSQAGGADSLQKTALITAQLGLAAWQFRQDRLGAKARAVAAAVIGKKQLAQQATVPALLKLFALKEMTET